MAGGRTLGAAAAAVVCAAVSGTGPGAASAAQPAQVFTPVADGFVSASAPRASHGRARSLQLRARPPSRAYLRFRIGRLRGGVVSARLRVYLTRPARGSLQVRAIVRRRWDERSLSYRTAPGLKRVIATGQARAGWTSFDIGSLVDGPGIVELALVAERGSISVASRETRSKPTLRVNTAPLLLAAGDIASCSSDGDEATAALLEVPATIAALGDLAYPKGTADEFAYCYDPSWGRFRSSTRPAVGNHEYATPGAAAYFDYWGAAAGPRGAGYYSYELGSWHVVVLNSNCRFVACSAGSLQETWLRNDLALHRTRCTLAYFHHPLFSSTFGTATPAVRPLWQALYDAGADLVLSAHAHNYQRFDPQTPSGAADPARGIREFVVGTGGNGHHPAGLPIANQETTDEATYGVLRLTLLDTGYRWRFVPVAGGFFPEAGADVCHWRAEIIKRGTHVGEGPGHAATKRQIARYR